MCDNIDLAIRTQSQSVPNFIDTSDSYVDENTKNCIQCTEKLLIDDQEDDYNCKSNKENVNENIIQPAKSAPRGKAQSSVEYHQNNFTNGDKLREILSNEQIRKQIQDNLSKNGKEKQQPILKVSIMSLDNQECEIDKNDIIQVFKRYGTIQNVQVLPKGQAKVMFNDIVDALIAQKSLDNQQIPEINVKICVEWENQLKQNSQQNSQISNNQNNNSNNNIFDINNHHQGFQQIPQHQQFQMFPQQQQFPNQFNMHQQQPIYPYQENNMDFYPEDRSSFNSNQNTKFTCRYDIQIHNDKEFQVARKIIGSKGYHMKEIISSCDKSRNEFGIPENQEVVKIRLRGRGSGYKEGPEQMESNEPLHLCVSSRYIQIYQIACNMIDTLLTQIYKEYKQYCQKKGRHIDPNLGLKKRESTNGKDGLPNNNNNNINKFNNAGNLQQQQMYSQQSSFSNIGLQGQPPLFMMNPNIQDNGDEDMMEGGQIRFQKSQSQQDVYANMNTQQPQIQGGPNLMKANSLILFDEYMQQPTTNFELQQQQAEIDLNQQFETNVNISETQIPNNNISSEQQVQQQQQDTENIDQNKQLKLSEEQINSLVESRNRARKELNFKEADRIRNYLKNKGVSLIDEKGGRGKGMEVTTWRYCKQQSKEDQSFLKNSESLDQVNSDISEKNILNQQQDQKQQFQLFQLIKPSSQEQFQQQQQNY